MVVVELIMGMRPLYLNDALATLYSLLEPDTAMPMPSLFATYIATSARSSSVPVERP